ncbi:alpha-xenorhabdolysin family binary toxin subunit A [Shewanella sp. VB17]|uniref:alpha-xenorhabdolysin family binary toxin subunit A n=1 Tax=Shewanella sp. VB17 TaxID=2739432 RepID=UPI001567C0EA|nr:alpha-xenorhabdolysin family binary toxin subunit A [Shewanella sp. VB17]NRD71791.1 alpha-xenorhabdolysin family binary toxin subunit A [Shewanella sp. VB17]
MEFKKNVLAIFLVTMFSTNLHAQERDNVLLPADEFTETVESDTGEETENFVLDSDEWAVIQVFAITARTLPITEEAMRNRFKMSDSLEFGYNYQELLGSYESVHDIAGQWLDPNGYRDQMVDLANSISAYATSTMSYTNPAYGIPHWSQQLLDALISGDQELALSSLVTLKSFLELMQTQAEGYYSEADELGDGLTSFINTLDEEKQELSLVQQSNAEILENDGSATKIKIDQLQDSIEEKQQEWSKWVTVASTSPTYVTVAFPFGAIASISAAAAGTAKAIALRTEINFLKDDLKALADTLDTEELTYASWIVANSSIDNTRQQISNALTSLEKLKGGWSVMVGKLDAILATLETAQSEGVIDNPVVEVATALTLAQLDTLEEEWDGVKESSEGWVRNAYVTSGSE